MNEKTPTKIDKLSAKESERCYTAQQLDEMFADKRNYLYMVFLQKNLHELITVNTAFESNNVNALKLMEDLINLFKNYLAILIPPIRLGKILNQESMSFCFNDYVMSEDFLNFGYTFNEASVGVDETEQTNIKERCKVFLIKLCKQIQCILPANIDILQKNNFSSPENATAQVRRPDITSLASTFNINI
ncbi:hypothetical protein PV327_002938 [Microctonus hyperodae]|uniref:Uncharacterized protein n=1 Tax=Microctonus hyperodae TaxID=165561 RepID=A0AA39G3T3_MICHY|nr:hypothetical protein PV327_002938 [Microctonus hyperodae]